MHIDKLGGLATAPKKPPGRASNNARGKLLGGQLRKRKYGSCDTNKCQAAGGTDLANSRTAGGTSEPGAGDQECQQAKLMPMPLGRSMFNPAKPQNILRGSGQQ